MLDKGDTMEPDVGTKTKDLARAKDGTFKEGVSGNPLGRPKGSKNKVTLMKIAAEEAVRDNNFDDMLEVCRQIVGAALDGDKQARKLVWESMMTKGVAAEGNQGTKAAININLSGDRKADVIDVTPVEESTDG